MAFQYINCLGRPYYNSRDVKSIRFPISRYSENHHTIGFLFPVSESHAIRSAELFLSATIQKKYFFLVKDDLFHNLTWDEARTLYATRGSLMTDMLLLEATDRDDYHQLTLTLGA